MELVVSHSHADFDALASQIAVSKLNPDVVRARIGKDSTPVRDFLALHYRFNTRKTTPFWQACVNDTPLGNAGRYVDYYQAVGPDFSLLNVDLKRDFFDADGYLAMLVGQQVPYQRKPEINFRNQHAWKLHLSGLQDLMHDAMDMPEYLGHVRQGTSLPTHRTSAINLDIARDGIGELRWH